MKIAENTFKMLRLVHNMPKSVQRKSMTIALALLLVGLYTPMVIQPVRAVAFSIGDVFAAVYDGKVQHYDTNGNLLETLDTGLGGYTDQLGFDSSGNLYVTCWDADTVYKFSNIGAPVGVFGSGYSIGPNSILFDATGNVYVGHWSTGGPILKLDSTGIPLTTYHPASGAYYIDLAADQTTMFYTDFIDRVVKRFDVGVNIQLADFATSLPGSRAYDLRILPGGSVLVANHELIVRLNIAGNVIQTYDAPSEDAWNTLSLDSDGSSFWGGNVATSNFYKFDIASGSVLLGPVNTGTPSDTLWGLGVYGEKRVARPLANPSAFNVALNAKVTLNGGPFFTDGWGGGQVVSKDTIVDGVFVPEFNQWDQGPVWWDSHDSVDRYVIIDLGDVYNIESLIVQADDNDAYLLYYWDITAMSWELAWHVPNYDFYQWVDLWGMQTRPNPVDNTERYLLPQKIITNALMFKGDMQSTDFWFAVSEIQAYGYPAAHRYVDIKPGSWPNPINLVSEGVLPVAICGSADFDVTTINVTTIKLTRQGLDDGVSPIRWSYEDVATPWTGEPGGGHTLEGDGYLDLTLKFTTQEVRTTLGLDAFLDQTIPLIITGRLNDAAGGTPFAGQDYIWVLFIHAAGGRRK